MSSRGRVWPGRPTTRIWMASLPSANTRRWARTRTVTNWSRTSYCGARVWADRRAANACGLPPIPAPAREALRSALMSTELRAAVEHSMTLVATGARIAQLIIESGRTLSLGGQLKSRESS